LNEFNQYVTILSPARFSSSILSSRRAKSRAKLSLFA